MNRMDEIEWWMKRGKGGFGVISGTFGVRMLANKMMNKKKVKMMLLRTYKKNDEEFGVANSTEFYAIS